MGSYGPHAGNNRSDDVGGGHAHAGAMLYLGGSWPAEYRNRIFMNNVHGARTNTDILEREGSGYVGRHGPDFLVANDSWSQLINLRYGPDGSVFLIDWYDKNQCHSTNPDVHNKTLGRIYRVAYEQDRPVGCGAWRRLDAGIAEIRHLWVAGDTRGLGLGRRLLDGLENAAAGHGIGTVRLGTHGVLTEAITLYRTNGYREISPYDGSPYNQLAFEKPIRCAA